MSLMHDQNLTNGSSDVKLESKEDEPGLAKGATDDKREGGIQVHDAGTFSWL